MVSLRVLLYLLQNSAYSEMLAKNASVIQHIKLQNILKQFVKIVKYSTKKLKKLTACQKDARNCNTTCSKNNWSLIYFGNLLILQYMANSLG